MLFQVKDGVYTNASVEKVIENAIISRVFENLPQHLPYKVNIEIQDVFETDHELVIVALLIVSGVRVWSSNHFDGILKAIFYFPRAGF